MQYAAFARSFHGASVAKLAADTAASCWSAVHAQGFSSKAERSAHAAETAVPPGHVAPSAQVASVYVQGGGV